MTGAAARALRAVVLARSVLAAGGALPPDVGRALERTNHRGVPVSLLSGPAVALAAVATSTLPRRAALVAGLGAAAVGAYDDVVGARPEQRAAKGFAGHLAALRRGRLTAGGVKVLGISTAAVLAASALPPRPGSRAVDRVVDGAVVAGAANLLNLFDLRPGRALKVALGASLVLREPGPAGAALALLPPDLHERTMLGDTGANALGALLGLAWVARTPSRRRRSGGLVLLGALTAASEVVSYSRVIDAVAPLRTLDRLGRLPAP